MRPAGTDDPVLSPLTSTGLRVFGSLFLILGIAAIIMPDRLPAIMAAPLAGSDSIAVAINNGIDVFVGGSKPGRRKMGRT